MASSLKLSVVITLRFRSTPLLAAFWRVGGSFAIISIKRICKMPEENFIVSICFGNDDNYSDQYFDLVAVGAFSEVTSQRIFEKLNMGMLA